MRDAIVLVFLLFALMLSGVLTSSWSYIRAEFAKSQEIKFWLSSIVFSVIGLILFGIGTVTTAEAIKSNSVAFTFANAFYLASIIFQTLFCFSLIKNVSSRTVYMFLVGLLIFTIHFEYLRGAGNFVGRVLEVAFISSIFLITQLVVLRKVIRNQASIQIKFLMFFTCCELAMVVGRVIISAVQVNPVLSISAIPMSLVAILWFNLAFNVLSYLTMLGFWSERAKFRQIEIRIENERISSLLQERESLINSLLLSNKSAVAGAMSASLAHELNQPIGASRINLFMLKKLIADKSISDQELHDVISRIESDNQRAGDIIASLRAIFTQAPQNIEKINLLAIVESTVGLVVGECKKHQIELKINIPTELEVKVSRVALQQVLLNLLNNAIDALKEIPLNRQRQIFILAKNLGSNYTQITIQDNGPGISEHFCDQLFELFSAQKQSGLGVGLWLCRYILERSDGTITYEPNPSGGSQFFLNIPRWGDMD